MGKFLTYYLAVTGLAAIFTLKFPGWVYMLLYVGVGIILIYTPTAFMWGCIFALGYGLARTVVRPVFAMTAALMVTAFTLWVIPQPSIRAARALLDLYQLENVTPTELIRLEGDVRIDTPDPQPGREWPGVPTYRCDDRCLAVLFEPNVSSVTMTRAQTPTFEYVRTDLSQPDIDSRTYRLVPKAQCGDGGIEFDPHRGNRFGKTDEDRRAVAADWSMRLAIEYCLTSAPPLSRYDMVLRTGYWHSQGFSRTKRSDLPIREATAEARFSDIRNSRGEVLFRRFDLVADALGVPLAFLPMGEDFVFGWSRSFLPPSVSAEGNEPEDALDAAIAVKRTAAIGDSIALARKAVQVAFVDSTTVTGRAATLVIRNYMEMLGKTEPAPQDITLINSLLRDPRLDDLPGAWLLPRIFSPEQLNRFLPAIISKLSTETATEPARENQLGQALQYWPKSAFANPDQATLALLADPGLRIRAAGLVARMSDMGERAAPMLADIIEQHLVAAAKDSSRDQLQLSTANAGVSAMCYLGAQAARELPRMRDIEGRVAIPDRVRRRWDFMMLRLGKPLTEIKRPANSTQTEQQHLSALRYGLAHFDAERDCRNL